MVGPLPCPTGHDRPRRRAAGSGLADMEALVTKASLPDPARDMAIGVYRRLAEAEARVHGSDPDAVRFHEVGSLRSFAGVLGTALALDDLGIERVVASPLPFGRGIVDTAHGRTHGPRAGHAGAAARDARGTPGSGEENW